ncbi:hypothetical protein MMALV_06800 [Candidatus Methanomethylophilus alvi Mx1201]|nr:hypothetical protein MMALV_06800 [Candidatus Methanomethylophilus alvi Mx1201]
MPSNVKAEPIKKLMSKAIDELKASSSFAFPRGEGVQVCGV